MNLSEDVSIKREEKTKQKILLKKKRRNFQINCRLKETGSSAMVVTEQGKQKIIFKKMIALVSPSLVLFSSSSKEFLSRPKPIRGDQPYQYGLSLTNLFNAFQLINLLFTSFGIGIMVGHGTSVFNRFLVVNLVAMYGSCPKSSSLVGVYFFLIDYNITLSLKSFIDCRLLI